MIQERGWSENSAKFYLKVIKNNELISLDSKKDSGDEDSGEFGDFVIDQKNSQIEAEVGENMISEELRSALERLRKQDGGERYFKVIVMRYIYGVTLQQAGDELGVTRERIRQLENKALAKLRIMIPPRRVG
jgi:RNA polymerase primary sigma factor